MQSGVFTRSTLLAGTMVAALLSGCVVAPVGPYRPYYGEQEVMVAPPAPQAEVVGVAPVPGYFWIGGYWGWRGGAHYWNPGHWERPREGYRWAPHQWTPYGHGWREAPGHWERR